MGVTVFERESADDQEEEMFERERGRETERESADRFNYGSLYLSILSKLNEIILKIIYISLLLIVISVAIVKIFLVLFFSTFGF